MPHKILMVEDDFVLAMGTEYALTSEGYAVTTAGNLAQRCPDYISDGGCRGSKYCSRAGDWGG